MKKKSFFIVPLTPYPFDVIVSFDQTDEQLQNSLVKEKIPWSDGMLLKGWGRFYIMREENKAIIRLWKHLSTPEDHGTLAHEIFHAITYILDQCRIKFKVNTSDEAYAYMVGYLTTEIYKKM